MRALLAALVIVGGCAGATWHGFPVQQVEIGGMSKTVAVASTNSQQSKGLSGVTSLDGIDGMLFEFPDATNVRFWMKDTLIPLDVAFFDVSGVLIEVIGMDPCTEDPCPTYGPSQLYRWAVEAPAGGFLSGLPADATLVP